MRLLVVVALMIALWQGEAARANGSGLALVRGGAAQKVGKALGFTVRIKPVTKPDQPLLHHHFNSLMAGAAPQVLLGSDLKMNSLDRLLLRHRLSTMMADAPSEKVLGIDLGTTFSVVAVVDEDGVPRVIVNEEGDNTTPSVVYFDNGEPVVGKVALDSLTYDPGNVIMSVKRMIGRTYQNLVDEGVIDSLHFEVVDQGGMPLIVVDGEQYTPQQISAYVLRKLKTDAENKLGTKINKAVITVPALL